MHYPKVSELLFEKIKCCLPEQIITTFALEIFALSNLRATLYVPFCNMLLTKKSGEKWKKRKKQNNENQNKQKQASTSVLKALRVTENSLTE